MSVETEMPDLAARSAADWDRIADLVTARVRAALSGDERAREALAAYLRDLEEAARREQVGAAAQQVIASARRLLGERPGVKAAPPLFLQLPV